MLPLHLGWALPSAGQRTVLCPGIGSVLARRVGATLGANNIWMPHSPRRCPIPHRSGWRGGEGSRDHDVTRRAQEAAPGRE